MTGVPRFFCPAQLISGTTIDLPAGAARHVQVLRLQPGDSITLFGHRGSAPGGEPAGRPGGEFEATIRAIGRRDVSVAIGQHSATERESSREIHLAIGMPANERMDWLVEKATELGVARIQPLMTGRSVVRLDEARASKKTAHWNSIAVAACEQCGRNQVPTVLHPMPLALWIRQSGFGIGARLVLSLQASARSLRHMIDDQHLPTGPATVLLGPEGGLSAPEEAHAIAQGFVPASLGARVLRAETAALVALTLLA